MTSVKDLNAEIISVKAVAMDMTDLGLGNGALTISGQDVGSELKSLSPNTHAEFFRATGWYLIQQCDIRPGRSADNYKTKSERVSHLIYLPTKAMITPAVSIRATHPWTTDRQQYALQA